MLEHLSDHDRRGRGAEVFAKQVADLTDNRFKIQLFAAGEIVPGNRLVSQMWVVGRRRRDDREIREQNAGPCLAP